MKGVTVKTNMASTARTFLLRLALAVGVIAVFVIIARAGGPKCVAGTSYFDPTTTGQALTWPLGQITYNTDQGDLSPTLPNASANSFVAGAFGVWTSVPTATLTATRAGSLAEDVSGTNVTVNADGTISMPSDVQSTATGTPIGIVYDYDGAVTSALLGAGAGGSSECFFNAVFGGNDSYGPQATYQHALIVINGQCAQQSSQLTDVEYRLVRVIGGVLGLGWSQLNVNVQSGSPYPGADDYAGFPLMHFMDVWNCVPITLCYLNPLQLSMDDMAAVSRLYPVTAQNQSSFPGKQIFSTTTARIHGSVYFSDAHGNRTQPMQGVNVVARWIDPNTHQPSRRYAASSVSGFSFRGNGGNPVTGFDDWIGDPLAEWGSTDSSAEGSFDLAGLAPPSTGAQYQLSLEGIDPKWSAGVGPYSPGPVSPSGYFQPVTVTVMPGGDVQQDILMAGSAQPLSQPASSWSAPLPLPSGGDWGGSFATYGDVDYVQLHAQVNRTLSVAVTSLDENGQASISKAQPVIGMWAASDPAGSVPGAFTTSPFNQVPFGLTRLDASILASGNFLIGISDVRGDGRPDYRYHAHVLYADSLVPPRVSVNGGVITVRGTGFGPGMSATVGSNTATPLAVTSTLMTLAVPAHADGLQNIAVSDAASGASTIMTGALTYGAAASDNIILLNGANPSTPVGVKAANPMSVRVVASDGVTPIGGATVAWSGTNGVQLSVCGGTSSCTVSTDQNGNSATWLTAAAPGASYVTATLAPGVYSPSKSVTGTLSATQSSSDMGVSSPYVYASQGATVSVPISARVLSNGNPKNNAQVNFSIVSGAGSLSAASAVTDANGYASVTLSVTNLSGAVQGIACVGPSNAPCGVFYVNPVPLAQQLLQQVSGAGQVSIGQGFQAVLVRVVDSAPSPHPVIGAVVNFLTTVMRPGGMVPGVGSGDPNPGKPAMPVILKVTPTIGVTDTNGLASVTPSSGDFSAPVEVDVTATVGTSGFLDDPLFVWPKPPAVSGVSGSSAPVAHPIARPIWVRGATVLDRSDAELDACGEQGQPCPRHGIDNRMDARQ
ncbi:MAG TPA: IPT/TIG domain-containing protein [Candidatus Binatia bacterium]|nr:IPT/TIG domain-containing protein [Candidatus Binatia bacterium]